MGEGLGLILCQHSGEHLVWAKLRLALPPPLLFSWKAILPTDSSVSDFPDQPRTFAALNTFVLL